MQTLKERLWCSTTRSPSTFESLLPKCISLLLGVVEIKKKPLLLIKMFHLESTAIFSPNTPSACRTLHTDPRLYFTWEYQYVPKCTKSNPKTPKPQNPGKWIGNAQKKGNLYNWFKNQAKKYTTQTSQRWQTLERWEFSLLSRSLCPTSSPRFSRTSPRRWSGTTLPILSSSLASTSLGKRLRTRRSAGSESTDCYPLWCWAKWQTRHHPTLTQSSKRQSLATALHSSS